MPLEGVQDGAAFGQACRGRRDIDEERPSPYKLDGLAAEPARGHCATIRMYSRCNGGRSCCHDRLGRKRVAALGGRGENEEQKLEQEAKLGASAFEGPS